MKAKIRRRTAQRKRKSFRKRAASKLPKPRLSKVQIFEANLNLASVTAGRIGMTLPQHSLLDHNDLQSCSRIGLWKAVKTFRRDAGATLPTFAAIKMRGAIYDELRRVDWVPRSVRARIKKVESIYQQLAQKLRRKPEAKELAEACGLTLRELERVLYDSIAAHEAPVRFDSPVMGGDNDLQFQEIIPDLGVIDPLEAAARSEEAGLLIEALKSLRDPHQTVLRLYYGEGLRLREIAERYELTESRICQLHAAGIQILRSRLENVFEN